MIPSDKITNSREITHHNEKNFDLNLYNFENEGANNSPYILTSPRSLKACRLANIKPIELLHRSVSEIAKDLNLPIQCVNHVYNDYEQERLRKLEICKLVRKHILQTCEFEQNQTSIAYTSLNTSLNRETTSRLSNYAREDTPEFQFLKEKTFRSSYSTPSTPILRFNPLKRKETGRSLICSLSSSSSSISSVTFDEKQRSKSVECEKYRNFHSKKIVNKNTFNAKKKSNKHNSKLKNEIGKKYQMSETERMNDQQLCWQIDNVKKSRITSNNKKNTPKNKNIGQTSETKKSKNRRNLIEQNNFFENCEKAINQKSQKNIKITRVSTKSNSKPFNESRNCSKKINDKYNESVRNGTREKSENENQPEDNGGLEGLKNHDMRILDAMALKRELQQTQDNFAQRARLVWASSPNEVPSNINHKNLPEAPNDLKYGKPDCCHFSENITFETYFNHIRNKMKQLKEDSLHKELHSEHVRQLARELQLGMEQWQDQVLLLQWQALQRARTNAKLNIENKRLKIQCENNERALLHALRLKNVQNMERIKQLNMKKDIEEKDDKIEKLKIKREREILDCRAQAHYTAELREQLRRTLTPQTFDQKVNDAMIRTRFINRSLTASPFIESHIRLG